MYVVYTVHVVYVTEIRVAYRFLSEGEALLKAVVDSEEILGF